MSTNSLVVAIVVCATAALAQVVTVQAASPVEGTWQTENGTEIAVAPCAQGFCGMLSYIVVPQDQSALCQSDKAGFAAQMKDDQNPDQSLRSRSTLGITVLALSVTNDPAAFDAQIYDPSSGKTYGGKAWVESGGSILKFGAACAGNFCAVTQNWPLVPARGGLDIGCTQ